MKRILLALLALLLLLTAAGCGKDTASSEEPEETQAQAATEAPYIDTQISEPEWTLAEGELSLQDATTTYAQGDQILYFAIVTKDDGKQELRFRLSDEAAAILQSQSADVKYYMTFNGEKIGDAVLNDDCTEAVISEENAVGDITALASRIRGLSE